jgi:hypothetical protein
MDPDPNPGGLKKRGSGSPTLVPDPYPWIHTAGLSIRTLFFFFTSSQEFGTFTGGPKTYGFYGCGSGTLVIKKSQNSRN